MPAIRLSKKEYAAVYGRQQSDRTAVEILTREAKRKQAAVDPDLPVDVQTKQRARVQREYHDKVGPILYAMRERKELIESQAPFYTRAALLRRAGVEASVQTTLVVQRASDAGLAQLALDAAADNNFELAGAVALEIGPRALSLEHSRVVSDALAALEMPDIGDLDARLFRPVRDVYLQSELDALEVTGGSAVEKLTYARALGQPILGVDNAA